ncbi:MAG: hypothetical protein AB8H86_10370 [Polyangiales bacterium]
MRVTAFVLCILGCTGSEVGNPPFQPEVPGPAFDPSVVEVVPHPAGAGQNIFRLPESAVPGVVRMTATFLDEANSARQMTRGDNMFVMNVSAMSGTQRLRVEGRTNTARIAPMDFDLGPDGVRFVDAAGGCIELETRSVHTDSDIPVRARNRCDSTITVRAALRVGDWLADPTTQDAAPGEVVHFDLTPAELAGNDTLLLSAGSETMAITLWR